MRRIKRRQFGKILATATLSLGGVSGAAADASAQETDPLQGENVSVSFSGVTASFGRATLAFEDNTMGFRGDDWTIEGAESTLSGDTVRVIVEGVSAATYSTVREAMVETLNTGSALPLGVALVRGDIDSDAGVGVTASPVKHDGHPVADQITATGRFGAVTPEGLGELAEDGGTLKAGTVLGPSEWNRLTVKRGDTELVFDDAVVDVRAPGADGTADDVRFDLTFGTVTRNGETLASNVETSGTLAELLQALPTTDVADAGAQRLSKEAVVRSPNTEVALDYVFEVTGDLEKLEPNEDVGNAVDEVSTRGDRVRVEGTVSTGDDRFAFSGDLIEVDVPPEVEIVIRER